MNDARRLVAAELAASTGADAHALARALRLLSAYGIFEPVAGHRGFAHTPASRLLRTDDPRSMRSFVRMIGNSLNWKSFELLDHSIRTGKSATEQITPGGAWVYYAQHPEEGRIFDEAMTGKAHGQIAGILAGYDFSPFKTIADIGGGKGRLLKAVLALPRTLEAYSSISRMSSKTLQATHLRALRTSGRRFLQRCTAGLRCVLDHASHSRLE